MIPEVAHSFSSVLADETKRHLLLAERIDGVLCSLHRVASIENALELAEHTFGFVSIAVCIKGGRAGRSAANSRV